MKQLGDKYQRRKQELSLKDRLNSVDFRGIRKNITTYIPITIIAGLLYGCSPKNVHDSIQIQAEGLNTGIVRDFDDYKITISYENEAAREISKMINEFYPRGRFRFVYNGKDTTTVTRFTDKLAHKLTTSGYEQVQDTTKGNVLKIKFTRQKLKEKQH